RTFFHGHTYTGNPLGAAVALASLELMESRKVLAGVTERAALLRRHLDRIAELPCVGDVRQKGLMAGIELVAGRPTQKPFPPAARPGPGVCKRARPRGALLRPLGDVVVLMPPLGIDLPLLDRLGEIVFDSICEVCLS